MITQQGPAAAGLTKIERVKIKDLALGQIRRYIASGAVAPGGRLPSERDLAKHLGIGRNSVREALKVLESIGVVESRIGEGTFITERPGIGIGRTIGLNLASWGGTIIEIIAARQMIEGSAARVAAERADDDDVRAMEHELSRMQDAGAFPDYLQADMSFHRLVGQATHNAIVAGIITNLIDMLEAVLHEAGGDQLPTWDEGTATHQAVFEAIARRNPAAAADAMRRHLKFSTELWEAITSLGAASQLQRPD